MYTALFSQFTKQGAFGIRTLCDSSGFFLAEAKRVLKSHGSLVAHRALAERNHNLSNFPALSD
jgi:hypothetical protein